MQTPLRTSSDQPKSTHLLKVQSPSTTRGYRPPEGLLRVVRWKPPSKRNLWLIMPSPLSSSRATLRLVLLRISRISYHSRSDELVAGVKKLCTGTTRPKSTGSRTGSIELATAIDQTHVHVQIPETYRERPVQFIDMVLGLPLVVGNKIEPSLFANAKGLSPSVKT